jgi:hypothetical protein
MPKPTKYLQVKDRIADLWATRSQGGAAGPGPMFNFRDRIKLEALALQKKRREWLLAVLAYGEMHQPMKGIPKGKWVIEGKRFLRTNLDLGLASIFPREDNELLAIYSAVFSSLSEDRRTILRSKIRNLITPSATPTLCRSTLGTYYQLRPQELFSDNPFVTEISPLRLQNPTGWKETSRNASYYAPEHFSVSAGPSHCTEMEDWFGDEPYFVFSGSCVSPAKIVEILNLSDPNNSALTEQVRVTPNDMELVAVTTKPGSGIHGGDDYYFAATIFDKINVVQGFSIWSLSAVLMEEDISENETTKEYLGMAQDALKASATTFDIIATVGAGVPIVTAIAEIGATVSRAAGQVISVALTLMGIFKDNDDFLGEATVACSTVEVQTSQFGSYQHTFTVHYWGDGARYDLEIVQSYEGCVTLAEELNIPPMSTQYARESPVERSGCYQDKQDEFFFVSFPGHYDYCKVTITPHSGDEDQVHLIPGTVALRKVKQGDDLDLSIFKFTVQEDQTLVSFRVHWWYNILNGCTSVDWDQDVWVSTAPL